MISTGTKDEMFFWEVHKGIWGSFADAQDDKASLGHGGHSR